MWNPNLKSYLRLEVEIRWILLLCSKI